MEGEIEAILGDIRTGCEYILCRKRACILQSHLPHPSTYSTKGGGAADKPYAFISSRRNQTSNYPIYELLAKCLPRQ